MTLKNLRQKRIDKTVSHTHHSIQDDAKIPRKPEL